MSGNPRKSIQEIFDEGTPIDEALARGVASALRRHKMLGNSIVVWQDGRVVHIPADQIQVPDVEDRASNLAPKSKSAPQPPPVNSGPLSATIPSDTRAKGSDPPVAQVDIIIADDKLLPQPV